MIQKIIEAAWDDRSLLQEENTISAIREVVNQLDLGALRIAEKKEGKWIVHEWLKKAVILYFPIHFAP